MTGKAENLLGTAPAASKGQTSAIEIQDRPYLRRGEILEAVPGVVITQHAGGGKANQYFLRGFNLDHGTDFAISIDGMPVNMRTHAHGQGYADLNILIPETIERIDYEKGTYAVRNGDLSSAGSANFKTFDTLPGFLGTVEIGEDNFYRALLADSFRITDDDTLSAAVEYDYDDGPWDKPDQYSRWNGFLKYFHGDTDHHFSLTLQGYHGIWQSSDQIPQRAILDERIGRFGSIDPTTGGDSSRYSITTEWLKREGDDLWRVQLYGFYYDLDLFSDFTYFLDNPERGDQFEQAEQRKTVGGEVARSWDAVHFWSGETRFSVGLQTRHDFIDPIGLYKTEDRHRFRTVREDTVYEGSAGIYAEAATRWKPWLRTILGVRGDLFDFDVSDNNAANAGEKTKGLISPKFTAILGPWALTEIYLNFGTGFHSNDARGVNNTVDPSTGERVAPVDPLVRTVGAELGVRTQIVPKLTASVALWWLDSDSELIYVGDEGTNEAGPASRRIGLEFTAYYRPVPWFSFDGEFSVTHARFLDAGRDKFIPDSIPWMFSGGITFGKNIGWFAAARVRAFAKRPLIEDDSEEGKNSFITNVQAGYRTPHWEVALECLNLFDRHDNDIEYFYTSRLPGEPAEGVDDTHLHPTEPRQFRVRLTTRF